MPTKKYIVPITLAVIFLKQLLFIAVIPPWQNYDEGAHFSYVQYIAEEKTVPFFQKDENRQASFSPEYIYSRISLMPETRYSLSLQRIAQALNPADRHPVPSKSTATYLDQPARPSEGSRSDWHNPAATYPPAYYLLATIPYLLTQHTDIVTRLQSIRVLSAILFLITVFFSYRIAMRLTGDTNFSLALMSIIGWLPVFSYTSAGVNNDVLLTTLATIALYLTIVAYERVSWKNTIWLGIVLGLGLLTKPQFPIFVLIACAPFCWHWLKKNIPTKQCAQHMLSMLGIALLLGGWWYLGHHSQFSANFFISGSASAIQTGTISPTFINGIFLVLYRWLYIFITFFFTVNFDYILDAPRFFVMTGTALSMIAMGGLAYGYVTIRKKIQPIRRAQHYLLGTTVVILETAYIFIFLKKSFINGYYEFPIDGRYLFPVIAPLLYFWLTGITRLLPPQYKNTGYALIVALMVTGTVWFIGFVLTPFYAAT